LTYHDQLEEETVFNIFSVFLISLKRVESKLNYLLLCHTTSKMFCFSMLISQDTG